MAFRNNGNQGNRNGNDDSWKSQGFVNIYLESKDAEGKVVSRRKIGAIPLKDSKPYEAALLSRLTKGGDDALKAMKEVMVLDFQRTDKDVKEKDLPF